MAPCALRHVPPRSISPPKHSKGVQAHRHLREAEGMGTSVKGATAAAAADRAAEKKGVIIVPNPGGFWRRACRGGGWHTARLRGRAWALCLMVTALSVCARADPESDEDCASMVPLEEVRRGKSAFYSKCETLSSNDLGGCWTQNENSNTTGCQSCYITEDDFSSALFPVTFSEELDPCPTSTDFTELYRDQYGDIDVVTAESLTSTACPDGWLYFAETEHCYFKSPNPAKAENEVDAEEKCIAEDGWLIAIESEAENSFLVHNLLWIGFFGETYTGLVKASESSEWEWPEEADNDDYSCLDDYSDWVDGPSAGCSASFDDSSGGMSCMEIFPYEPKEWNPFSCGVGKHYVCEREPIGDHSSSTGSSTPSPTLPDATPTPAGTDAPATANPAAPVSSDGDGGATATPTPSEAASAAPSPSTGPTVAPAALGSGSPTLSPTPLATLAPTSTPTPATSTGNPAVPETSAPTVLATAGGTTASTVETTTDTPSPTRTVTTEVPSAARSWEGDNPFLVKKSGNWDTATYSLYAVEGDTDVALAEDVAFSGQSSEEEEDMYLLQSGCYRLQVTAGSNPLAFSWEVEGGDPVTDEHLSSGRGLDGSLFSVRGGVCGVESCEAICMSDYFTGIAGSATVCDGWTALLGGACDHCEEDADDLVMFQEECVRAGCDPGTECSVVDEEDTVLTQYSLQLRALLEVADVEFTSESSSISTGAQAAFESIVALWLGVEQTGVSITAVDGVAVSEEEEEDDDTARRRRRGLSWIPQTASRFMRNLQSSSTTETPHYTRYAVTLTPENSTESSVEYLQETVTASEGSVELQRWLTETGGTWGSASLLDLDAEALTIPVLTTYPTVGSVDDGSLAWYESNPLATGGAVAGIIMIIGLLIIICCVRRKKRKKAIQDTRGTGLLNSTGGPRRTTGGYLGRSTRNFYHSADYSTGPYDSRYVDEEGVEAGTVGDARGAAAARAAALGEGPSMMRGLDNGDDRNVYYSVGGDSETRAMVQRVAAEGGYASGRDAGGEHWRGRSDERRGSGSSSGGSLSGSRSKSRRRDKGREGSRERRTGKDRMGRSSERGGSSGSLSGGIEAGDAMSSHSRTTSLNSDRHGSGKIPNSMNGLQLNAMAPVSAPAPPTTATASSYSSSSEKPKNPTVLSSRHTNHSRNPSATSSIGTDAGSTKRPSVTGPRGALSTLNIGRGLSVDSVDDHQGHDVKPQPDDFDGPRRETAAEARSRRESVQAAERKEALEARLKLRPRQSSLEYSIPPSESTDYAMAADLLPTPTKLRTDQGADNGGASGFLVNAGGPQRNSGKKTRPPRPPSGRASTPETYGGGGGGGGGRGAYDSDSGSCAVGGARQMARSGLSDTDGSEIGEEDSDCASRAPSLMAPSSGVPGGRGSPRRNCRRQKLFDKLNGNAASIEKGGGKRMPDGYNNHAATDGGDGDSRQTRGTTSTNDGSTGDGGAYDSDGGSKFHGSSAMSGYGVGSSSRSTSRGTKRNASRERKGTAAGRRNGESSTQELAGTAQRQEGFDSEEDPEESTFDADISVMSGDESSAMSACTPRSSVFDQRYQRDVSGDLDYDDDVSDITDMSTSRHDFMSIGSATSWRQAPPAINRGRGRSGRD